MSDRVQEARSLAGEMDATPATGRASDAMGRAAKMLRSLADDNEALRSRMSEPFACARDAEGGYVCQSDLDLDVLRSELAATRDALNWTGSPTPHPEFLEWIANRIVNVYRENPNVDFVLSLRARAEKFRAILDAGDTP